MKHSVSVIIPAWRAATTIRHAVESVLQQTVPVLEVLVIDDGSPDDISGALAGCPDLVRVIRQPNGGASSARNCGLDEARGEWVAFLDADDEWLPTRLQKQFEAIEPYPEVRFVTGKYLLRGPDGVDAITGPRIATAGRPLRMKGAVAFDYAAACWTGTILVRRDAIGGHRFRTDLRTAEDREFWLRLILEVPVLAVAEPIAVHHVRANSLSTSDIADDCLNMMKVVELYESEIGAQAAAHWRAAVHRRAASVHLTEGRHREARGAALARVRIEPFSLEAWWIVLRTLLPVASR